MLQDHPHGGHMQEVWVCAHADFTSAWVILYQPEIPPPTSPQCHTAVQLYKLKDDHTAATLFT